ncbi:MAG: GGDEF domain-containing protein [Thermoanaerobaculum sp.]|nr:GGDEF domain-containing protein [Thermoanaerobaculum sp.]MDW7967158.1 GGDEF domain-containing protein [Thermoanaerobaculum sp.]
MTKDSSSATSNPRVLLPSVERLPWRGLDLERLINLVRLGVVGGLGLMTAAFRLQGTEPLPELSGWTTVLGIFIGLGVVQLFLAFFPWDPSYSRYLALLDPVLVTALLLGFVVSGHPLWASNSQVVFLGYPLALVLAGLRADQELALRVSVTVLAGYISVVLLLVVGFDLGQLPLDPVYGGFRWDQQVARLFLLGGCGVAVSFAARLAEAERTFSRLDPLTGVFNRRFLDEFLTMMVARAKRGRHPLSLLMVDLDDFKRYNDSFGHAAGDAMLREVALSLAGAVREENVVARYGGDEFIVVMPNTPGEVARQVAAELRQLFAEDISVSIGVACLGPRGGNKRDLLRAADEALYRAKNLGGGIAAAG